MSALVLFLALVSAQSNELDARYLEGHEKFVAGDYAAAREIWLPLAEVGDAQAQFSLAFFYEQGLGVTANEVQAIYWYERAALKGLAVAQFNLGNAYHLGRGVDVDMDEAARLWRLAAAQGLAEAQYNLATQQLKGSVPIESPGEPVLLLRSAAASGHPGARKVLSDQAFAEVRGALVTQRVSGIELAEDPSIEAEARTPAAAATPTDKERELERTVSDLASAEPKRSEELELLGDLYSFMAERSYARVMSMRSEVKRGILISTIDAKPEVQRRPTDSPGDVIATLDRWSEAWAAQDVNLYLAQYSSEFVPEGGQSLSAWRAQRRQRVSAPKFIEIQISDAHTAELAPGRVGVEFTQTYRSSTFSDETQKRLVMAREQDQWRIVRELSLP